MQKGVALGTSSSGGLYGGGGAGGSRDNNGNAIGGSSGAQGIIVKNLAVHVAPPNTDESSLTSISTRTVVIEPAGQGSDSDDSTSPSLVRADDESTTATAS